MVKDIAKLKICPTIGEVYYVEVPLPDYVNYEKDYVDAWIDDNLKYVEEYEVISFTTRCLPDE